MPILVAHEQDERSVPLARQSWPVVTVHVLVGARIVGLPRFGIRPHSKGYGFKATAPPPAIAAGISRGTRRRTS
jgi:hypothetical protein